MIGRSNARRGARRIFAVLQNRRLNQHIAYTVVDEVSQRVSFSSPCALSTFLRSLQRSSRKRWRLHSHIHPPFPLALRSCVLQNYKLYHISGPVAWHPCHNRFWRVVCSPPDKWGLVTFLYCIGSVFPCTERTVSTWSVCCTFAASTFGFLCRRCAITDEAVGSSNLSPCVVSCHYTVS